MLGTADIIEDLLLLGALDDKVVVGSMNRGGLAGTTFEIYDRLTGYDAESIARMGFDAGKMMFRIDPDDPATVVTMEACARAVSDLAAHGLMAMVEPFISYRADGRVRNDLSPEAVIRSIAVVAGLPRPCRSCCSAARSARIRARFSRAGVKPRRSRRFVGSSSGGHCYTRPTTTWSVPWIPPLTWSEVKGE